MGLFGGFGQGLVGTKIPGGFSVQKNDKLLFPLYLQNDNANREIISREALFSFPLAAAGLMVGGLVGVLAGHVIGATIGYYRNDAIGVQPSKQHALFSLPILNRQH